MLKQLSKLSIAASAVAAVGFVSTHNAKADWQYGQHWTYGKTGGHFQTNYH